MRETAKARVMLISSMLIFGSIGIFRRAIPLSSALLAAIRGFLGGLLGGVLFRKVPTLWLHRALGLLILYGGLRSVLF